MTQQLGFIFSGKVAAVEPLLISSGLRDNVPKHAIDCSPAGAITTPSVWSERVLSIVGPAA